jgi:hypothetical protein
LVSASSNASPISCFSAMLRSVAPWTDRAVRNPRACAITRSNSRLLPWVAI